MLVLCCLTYCNFSTTNRLCYDMMSYAIGSLIQTPTFVDVVLL